MLRIRLLACLCLLAPACPAAAAPPASTPAASAPAAADPLKPAFEALPEPARRALQDALVWTGDFNGAVAGSYGPRTRDALLAYAGRSGLQPGAALAPATRARLLAAAEAARGVVGFTLLRDPRAGLAIGLPLKLLPVRTVIPDGTRYAAPDGSVVVDTAGRDVGAEGLKEAFARLTRDAPGRRVTYRLEKPDFIVVSGETADRKFYSRYAVVSPPAGSTVLRGFTLSYLAVSPEMDRITLAVASSFDPSLADVPSAPPAPQAAARPVPSTAAGPATPPASGALGQAVLVGPGLALTRADRGRCEVPEVDGAPATWVRQDPGSGLALLGLPGHHDAMPAALSSADPAADGHLLALFLAPGDAAPTLSAASVTADGPDRVSAPLQGADAGVVVVDGAGAIAGITGARAGHAVAVRGVVATARYDLVGAARLGDFLHAASVPTATAGASGALPDAVARWRPAILPLRCRDR